MECHYDLNINPLLTSNEYRKKNSKYIIYNYKDIKIEGIYKAFIIYKYIDKYTTCVQIKIDMMILYLLLTNVINCRAIMSNYNPPHLNYYI